MKNTLDKIIIRCSDGQNYYSENFQNNKLSLLIEKLSILCLENEKYYFALNAIIKSSLFDKLNKICDFNNSIKLECAEKNTIYFPYSNKIKQAIIRTLKEDDVRDLNHLIFMNSKHILVEYHDIFCGGVLEVTKNVLESNVKVFFANLGCTYGLYEIS